MRKNSNTISKIVLLVISAKSLSSAQPPITEIANLCYTGITHLVLWIQLYVFGAHSIIPAPQAGWIRQLCSQRGQVCHNMTPKKGNVMCSFSLLNPAQILCKRLFFFFLPKAICFLNLKYSSAAFLKPDQGKHLQLMLHAIDTYMYIAKKLNTRIFEVSLSNLYLPSCLNEGYKQMASVTVPASLLCCQFSYVFPFLTMLSSHVVMQKMYTNDQEAD